MQKTVTHKAAPVKNEAAKQTVEMKLDQIDPKTLQWAERQAIKEGVDLSTFIETAVVKAFEKHKLETKSEKCPMDGEAWTKMQIEVHPAFKHLQALSGISALEAINSSMESYLEEQLFDIVEGYNWKPEGGTVVR